MAENFIDSQNYQTTQESQTTSKSQQLELSEDNKLPSLAFCEEFDSIQILKKKKKKRQSKLSTQFVLQEISTQEKNIQQFLDDLNILLTSPTLKQNQYYQNKRLDIKQKCIELNQNLNNDSSNENSLQNKRLHSQNSFGDSGQKPKPLRLDTKNILTKRALLNSLATSNEFNSNLQYSATQFDTQDVNNNCLERRNSFIADQILTSPKKQIPHKKSIFTIDNFDHKDETVENMKLQRRESGDAQSAQMMKEIKLFGQKKTKQFMNLVLADEYDLNDSIKVGSANLLEKKCQLQEEVDCEEVVFRTQNEKLMNPDFDSSDSP